MCIRDSTGEDIGQWEGKCKKCPRSSWRSANGESRGQACKMMRRLLVLPDGEDQTVAIHLPPTSIGIFDKFIAARANREDRAYYFCRVKMGTRIKSAGSFTWGIITLENLGRIQDVKLGQAIVDFQAAAKSELQAMAASGEDYFG